MGAEADAVRYWLAGAILVMLASVLPGCGGSGSAGFQRASPVAQGKDPVARAALPAIHSGGTEAAASELKAYLQAEFSRLGIDPAKVAAAAPRGEANAVFDLAAAVVDPDGEGGDQPTGIELTWTERCIGDYDQNGLVNASDLTPLGVHWQEKVEYDAPSLHTGCEYWPTGDPDDAGAGTDNWRCARIDGNDNGLVEVADITPIAVHFKERLSGYRVYRRGPLNTDWVLLPDPLGEQSQLSIAHPAAQADAPVRYSFADSPGYPGLYEYYVVGYALGSTGVSAMEGDEASNIAQVTLTLEGVDIYPPVWQGTVGIGSATANEDGTVTVEWGEAVDEEHPPAPASPPVTYSVYYGAETPLNFTSAVKIENASSPWISPQLVNGQEYYFAVRAKDSAAFPNEDENTSELAATITGGIVDDEPPVWTETYQYRHDNGSVEEVQLGGIQRLEVGDGKLKIWHAEAEDELSPPVHYDLYYISDRVANGVYDGYGLREEAQVVRDIPEVYELEWENRHRVHLAIQARDSASTANTARPPKYEEEYSTAPTSLRKIPVDMNMPLISQYSVDEVTDVKSDSTFDRLTHTLYVFYTLWPDPYTMADKPFEVWALELNMDTAEWEAVLVGSWNRGEGVIPVVDSAATAPDGTPWFIVTLDDIHSPKTTSYFYRRTGSGSYEVWDPPDRQGGWNGDFSFDNYPVFYVVDTSIINPDGQFQLSYRWWDVAGQSWHQERVCDPSGVSATSFVRPDGVVQLLTQDYLAFQAPAAPLYGHIHERQLNGTWTEVLRTEGSLGSHPEYPADWSAEWAWTTGVIYMSGDAYLGADMVVYNMQRGYYWMDDLIPKPDGLDCLGNWPAEGGGYHQAPRYIFNGNDLVETSGNHYEVWYDNPTAGVHHFLLPIELANGRAYDLASGWWAQLQPCYDPKDQSMRVQLFTADSGQSMYNLDD